MATFEEFRKGTKSVSKQDNGGDFYRGFESVVENPKSNFYNSDFYRGAESVTGQAPQKWYKGETPTFGESIGRIYQIAQSNPQRASTLFDRMQMRMADPDSMYYQPYFKPTNKAVANLAQMGFDTSKVDDKFFKDNEWLMQHLEYRGRTGKPSAPTKKSTPLQRAAYEYWRLYDAEGATREVEQELADLQNEISYYANFPGKNYSNSKIRSMLDLSKYKELKSMMEKGPYETNVYNRPVYFSEDVLDAMLWRARNQDYNGDIYGAIANNYMGVGNTWQEDADATARLVAGTDTYSPYSVGSTMEKQGLYFGVYEFNQQWIDDHAKEILNGNNEKAKQYYADIVNAEDYTQVLESQLAAMHRQIDALMKITTNPDEILNAIKANTTAYSDLFALDDSMRTGALKNTTRAVDYSMNDIERSIRERCDAENNKAGASDVSANVSGNTASETEKAIEKAGKELLEALAGTVESVGTDAEKTAYSAGKTVVYDPSVENIMMASPEVAAQRYIANSKDKIAANYVNDYSFILGYEARKADSDRKQANLDAVTAELNALKSREAKATIAAENDERISAITKLNGDPTWEHYKYWLENEPEGVTGQTQRDEALRYLYQEVTGDYKTTDKNVIESKAAAIWEAIESEGIELLTAEEQARKEELERWRDSLTSEIQEESDYFKKNERKYTRAKQQQDFLKRQFSAMGADGSLIDNIEYLCDIGNNNVQPEYKAYTKYDQAVIMGESSREDASLSAVSDVAFYTNNYKTVTDTYDYLVGNGVKFDEETIKNIEAKKKQMLANAKDAGYAMLDTADDFIAVSDAGVKNILSGNKYSEATMLALAFEKGRTGDIALLLNSQRGDLLSNISTEELRRYFYLHEKDGEDAATEYLNWLADPNNGVLAVRSAQNLENTMKEFASQPGLNPYIATAIGIGSGIMSMPNALAYRAGQALNGEAVSPYNPAYSYGIISKAAVQGSKESIVESCDHLFGEGNLVSDALTKLYDIGFGGAKMSIGSAAANEAFGALGVTLRSFETSIATDALKVKIVKSAAEVLPTTLASAEEKYRSVLMETKDETKAGFMYNVSLVSGLITHSVVMNGMHNAYQTDPAGLKTGISGLIEKVISTDTAVAGSTITSSTIEKLADKAIMKADGEWGKNVEKYKAMGFSQTMAEQAADGDMWQSVCNETFDAVVNATIRTVAIAGANKIGTALESAAKKVKDTWADVKAFAKQEFTPAAPDGKHWIADDNGRPVALEDIDEDAFKEHDSGYDIASMTVRDGDGKIVAYVPKTMIPNRLGETKMIDRVNGKLFTSIGYIADTDKGSICFFSTKGELIPYENVAAGYGEQEINIAGFSLDREYGLLGEVADRYSGTASTTSDYVYSEPITPEVEKDLADLGEAHDASTTGAAVAISGFLNSGNIGTDKAAGQIIVSDIAKGNPAIASEAMQQMVLNTPNPAMLKKDIISAALTNGAGREELNRAMQKVENGGSITQEDVKAFHEAIVYERKLDPKGFSAVAKATVMENRVANATIQKAAGDTRISVAASAVQDAMRKLAEREKELSDAQAERDVAIQNAQDATDIALNDIDNASNIAPVQQTWEHASKMDSNVANAEAKVEEQKQEVTAKQNKLKETNTEVMTEKRKEAVAEVAEQVEEEAQATAATVVEQAKPIAAFIQTDEAGNTIPGRYGRPTHMTFEAYDADGNAVNIVGVYDVVDNYEISEFDGRRRPLEPTTVYVTDDGRLVREAFDPAEPLIGEVTTENLDEASQAAIERTVQSIRSRGENARTRVRHPAIAAKAYFPSSFPMEVDGQQVQMIGLAGKKTIDGEELPVMIGMDGNLYLDDYDTDIPFDYIDAIDDLFFEKSDILPEVENVRTFAKENADVREERQEDSGTAGVPVQGAVGEGNNPSELAEQLGADVGRGDNGNAELGAEEGAFGRGEESPALDNGQELGTGNERFRSIIKERLQEGQVANDPNLKETKDYSAYSNALGNAKAANPFGAYVDAQSPEELEEKGAITLLSPDGMAGVSVGTKGSDAGNIFGVFNNPNGEVKKTMPFLMVNAIDKGGNKLDCFDGFLSRSYERFGFIPVARVPFSREHAPEGWNYERDGEPDVIIWMHNGDLADVVAQRFMFTEAKGGYHRYTDEEIANLPVFNDYGEALAHRDRMLENRDPSEGKFMYSHSLSTKNLEIAIQAGGVAGISVGVTKGDQKSGVFHFGEDKDKNNCIIFLREKSVDPENNPLNFIFGDDAFTTMFSEDVEWKDGKFINADTGEPVTRADIANMMAKQNVFGIVTKHYATLKEAKDDAGRLVSDESTAFGYSNPVEELDNAFRKLYGELSEEDKSLFRDDFDFEAKMNEAFPKIFGNGNISAEQVKRALDLSGIDPEEGIGITVTKEQAQELIDVGKKVNNLLTDYFEAKLMRDVPTAEWAGVGVDKNRPDLAEKLNEIGIPTFLLSPENKNEQAWSFYKTLIEADTKTPVDENGEAIITPVEEATEEPVGETPAVEEPVADELAAEVPATEEPVTTSESVETEVGEPAEPMAEASAEPPAEPPIDRNINGPVPAPERNGGPAIGQRQWGREGAQQSKILHQQAKDHIAAHNDYFKDTNNEQWNRAFDWIGEHITQSDPTGLYGAVHDIEAGDFNLWTADGQARLGAAIALAAESGDIDTETRLSDAFFNPIGTDIGQALQARKQFILMTPAGRKQFFRRAAQRIEDHYTSLGKKLKDENGNPIRLVPSEKVLEMAANAKSEADLKRAYNAMNKELAEKIPSDWGLKLRTWRYTAMLSGTKTHVRNIVGNIGNFIMYEARNASAAAIERLWGLKPGERTKSITRTPESVDFAKADVEHMLPELQGMGKYYETHGVERERKAGGSGRGRTAAGRLFSRTVGKAGQKAADTVSFALEKEDEWFLKLQYVRALSGYMTANKLTPKDMRGRTLTKARAYAVEEAWDATFRNENSVAKWLSNTGNKYVQGVVNAIQPFLKTPLNIAKTGVEFSPVGLAKTVIHAKKKLDAYDAWEASGFKGKRPKNAQSATEFIAKLSAGLTGTGLSALGYYLASIGVLKTRVNELDKLHGEQDFSLVIDGKSRDIKWAVPINIPMFFGAELYNQIEKLKGNNGISDGKDVFNAGLNAISDMLDPLIETTLFASLNNFLTTPRYVSNDKSVYGALGQKLAANYISSFFPAAAGDIAKTIDPVQRKAYTESGDEMSIWTSMLEQAQNKTPYLSMRNVPYINEWGEEKKTEGFQTILKNFLLPGEISEITDAEVDYKLKQIYDVTQDSGILPKHVKSVSINNEKINFTDQQWYEYNRIRGKESKKVLKQLITRPEFVELDEYPEIQANIVENVYKYAKAKAAQTVLPQKKFVGWEKGALEANNIVDYIFAKEEQKAKDADISSHKDALVRGITSSNLEGARTDVAFLQQAGIENSTIKKYVTDKIKPVYRDADDDERASIESMLQLLGVGYENYNFNNWLKSTGLPARPNNDNDWDKYMEDLDSYWQNYDFASNDPVGQYGKGTIDMNDRAVLTNDDGSISTEKSFSFYDDETGKEVLIPLIVNGKELTEQQAIDHYYDTVRAGKPEYLGMFDDWHDADEYAVMLHNRGDWYYHR